MAEVLLWLMGVPLVVILLHFRAAAEPAHYCHRKQEGALATEAEALF
jgi:hypothetical protein